MKIKYSYSASSYSLNCLSGMKITLNKKKPQPVFHEKQEIFHTRKKRTFIKYIFYPYIQIAKYTGHKLYHVHNTCTSYVKFCSCHWYGMFYRIYRRNALSKQIFSVIDKFPLSLNSYIKNMEFIATFTVILDISYIVCRISAGSKICHFQM